MTDKSKSNVRVCARVRPLLPQEKMKDCSIVIGAKTNSSEVSNCHHYYLDCCW